MGRGVTPIERLRGRSPLELLEWVARRAAGRATPWYRLLPDFVIIGAQRAGTTSFFRALCRHPDIYPSFPKEVHFFTNHYHRGVLWYRSHFPLARSVRRRGGRTYLAGEATPYYLAHPQAARRARQVIPQARLLVLLRNPADRAYSHYQHEVASGFEQLSFAEAIDREVERLGSDRVRLEEDESFRSFNYQHFSYLDRGKYVYHVAAWLDCFDADQLLILSSETFFARPAATMERAVAFLGLRPWPIGATTRYHQSSARPMEPATRARLTDYFGPHNQQLYDRLGVDFGWS